MSLTDVHAAVRDGLIARIVDAGEQAFAERPVALRVAEQWLHDHDIDYEHGRISRSQWLGRRPWILRRVNRGREAAADRATPARLL